MKHASTLAPQDWMKAAETTAIMNALGKGQALFVGGCVRNALLGEAVDDIDIATKHTPEEVVEILTQAKVKTIPTGIDHGTITAIVDGKSFEVTTLRKDVETDGRRAVVAFTNDWAEDAARRDFTINTLLMDIDGKVYDPLGQGLDDVRERRVVFVGQPEDRIAEDYLRILRYFRFHALYAYGEADKQALEACRAAANKIPKLSRERITQEFFKILSVEDPTKILSIMFENNILRAFSEVGYDQNLFKHLCTFQNNYGLAFLASRLFVLGGLNKNSLESLEQYLLIPKVFKKDIDAIAGVLELVNLNKEHAVKAAVYKYGRVATAQALMIELAQDRVMNGYAPKALEIVQNWDIPSFPVTGKDLVNKGVQPGPELGKELERLENEWINGGFKILPD